MPNDIKDIVITSAIRTPIGTFRGSLKDMQASDLGALVYGASLTVNGTAYTIRSVRKIDDGVLCIVSLTKT